MKSAIVILLSSVLSGVLFCLALPPADVWWLGWFAFIPIFVATWGRGFLYGFVAGLLALVVCAVVAKTGMLYSAKDFEGTDAWIYTGCGLYGFVVSLICGAWADKGAEKRRLWWFAALAVVLEACLLVQLPAHLALTQYRQPTLLFLASLGGIWLVSFLMWLSNLALSYALIQRRFVIAVEIPAALVLIPLIQSGVEDRKGLGPLDVAVVQTDLTDEKTLARLHSKASAQGSRTLVVWPEFAGLMLAPSGDTSRLVAMAAAPGNSPFVTSYNDDFQPLPHNVASLVTPQGVSMPYFKQKLFGGEKQMHTAGNKAAAVGKVGLNICFDSCFPAIIRETAQMPGVEVIALPTIDPPSPHHFIAALHAAFTPFRAAEAGIPIARADGYAHSMIVDRDGRILVETEKGEAVVDAKVSPPLLTVYRRFGDWFLYGCVGFVVLGLFLGRGQKDQA